MNISQWSCKEQLCCALKQVRRGNICFDAADDNYTKTTAVTVVDYSSPIMLITMLVLALKYNVQIILTYFTHALEEIVRLRLRRL